MGVYAPRIVLVAWWMPFDVADAVKADTNAIYVEGAPQRGCCPLHCCCGCARPFYTAVRVDAAFYTAVDLCAALYTAVRVDAITTLGINKAASLLLQRFAKVSSTKD